MRAASELVRALVDEVTGHRGRDDRARVEHMLVHDVVRPNGATRGACATRPWTEARDRDGDTALHGSCRDGCIAIVEKLIAWGADPNSTNRRGMTPLICAVRGGRLRVVELLIAAGADVNVVDSNGNTALMYACAKEDAARFARELLASGANANHRGSSGIVPLLLSCVYGDLGAVRVFVEHGADVHATQQNGHGALHAAAGFGHPHLIAPLVCAGALVDARNARDETPLMYAVHKNHDEVARELLRLGADRYATAASGETPCDIGLRTGKDAAQRYLISDL